MGLGLDVLVVRWFEGVGGVFLSCFVIGLMVLVWFLVLWIVDFVLVRIVGFVDGVCLRGFRGDDLLCCRDYWGYVGFV